MFACLLLWFVRSFVDWLPAGQIQLRALRAGEREPGHLQQPGGAPLRLPGGDSGAALQGLRLGPRAGQGLEPRPRRGVSFLVDKVVVTAVTRPRKASKLDEINRL